VDDLWATKSKDGGLIVRAISFQVFQPVWSYPPTSQTDGQTERQRDRETDGQTTCDRKTALCTIVHRAVKTEQNLVGVDAVVLAVTLSSHCVKHNVIHKTV